MTAIACRRGEISPLSCYKRGCRQTECKAANSRRSAMEKRLQAMGQWEGLRDPAVTIAAIRRLMEAGVTRDAIAAAAGTHPSVLTSIINGAVVKVQAWTEQRILQLDPSTMPKGKGVPVCAVGTRRRVEALCLQGWPTQTLADLSGVHQTNLNRILEGRHMVWADTADRLRSVYDRLWDAAPPADTVKERQSSQRVKAKAQTRGYLPPMAWDDDEIDNPKARPHVGRPHANRGVIVDEVAVERLKQGQKVPVNKVEQRTAIAELAASGVRSKEIADRLGMGLSSAIRTRNRITAAERRTA